MNIIDERIKYFDERLKIFDERILNKGVKLGR